MRVSIIGLGKLGFPLALSIARHHDTVGYDSSPIAMDILRTRRYPHREDKAQEYLNTTTLRIEPSVENAVAHGDIVLVIVQTPHRPEFEGVTRLPDERADFDYTFLRQSVMEVARAAAELRKKIVVCVMSTVLPGTMEREIKPLLNEWCQLVYNPAFPAMGTACNDFENPEFVLLGVDNQDAADVVREFYSSFINAPAIEMSVASAEATKVAYNSYITAKITLANTWMEICHRVGADVDDVTRALSMAIRRVVSSSYMKGGMSDSGPCHCRDLIALSWLSRNLNMEYDLFGDLAHLREDQTEWLAKLCISTAKKHDLGSIVILGKAYKAGTNLTVGSCATLLKNILAEYAWTANHSVTQWDPHVDVPRTFTEPAVFVIATCHDEFYKMTFPKGSAIIDPWGRAKDCDGTHVIRVGRR